MLFRISLVLAALLACTLPARSQAKAEKTPLPKVVLIGDSIRMGYAPLVAKKLAESRKFDAVICLGCVVRGETPHFEYVAGEAARGIMQVGLSTGVPTTFGVITADTLEQANDRAGGKAGNKGTEAAFNAIELANLVRDLNKPTD